MPRFSACFALLWAVCLGLTPLAAHAQQDRPHALTYQVDATASPCLSRDEFVATLATRLGYAPFHPRAERKLNISFTRAQDGRLRASVTIVELNGEERTRVLDGDASEDCRELSEGVVLAALIAVDPALAFAPPAATTTTPTSTQTQQQRDNVDTERPSAPTPEIAETSDEPDEDAPRWNVSFAAGAGLMLGTSPAPSAKVGGYAELALSPVRIQLGGHYDFGAQKTVGVGRIGIRTGTVQLSVCGDVWRFYFCGLGELELVSAFASGLPDAQNTSKTNGAAGVRIGVDLPVLEHLAFRIDLDLVAPFSQSRYLVGAEAAWEAPVVRGGALFSVVGSIF